MENLVEIVSGFILGLAFVVPILLKVRQILKEVGELLIALSKALEDGKISMDEVKSIIEEAKGILGIFGKEKKD